jgi:hypothetical protein
VLALNNALPAQATQWQGFGPDVSGTQYLLFSCVLGGCDVAVKLDWEGQLIEEMLMKREDNESPSNS